MLQADIFENTVHVRVSPVVWANSIQNILDPVLPLHALLSLVYHRRQVLHMSFGRKRRLLSPPFSLTFRNVRSICTLLLKKCLHLLKKGRRRGTKVQLQAKVYFWSLLQPGLEALMYSVSALQCFFRCVYTLNRLEYLWAHIKRLRCIT